MSALEGLTPHVLRVSLDGTPLPVISGTWRADEAWAPYLEAELTLAGGLDLLDVLDPRRGAHITLEAGSGPALTSLGTLAVTDARAQLREGTVRLAAHSGEYALQHLIYRGAGPAPLPTSTASAALRWVLSHLEGADLTVRADAPDVPVSGPAPGAQLWQTAADVADAAGLRLYHDGSTWILDTPATRPDIAAALTLGPGGTVIDLDTIRTREGWADAVHVTATWRDAAGVEHTTTGHAGAARPLRVHHVSLTTPTGQEGAQTHALAVLRRVSRRGAGYTLTAPADYRLRPADRISLTIGRDTIYQRIQSVSITWPSTLMTLRTIHLEEA